MRSWWNQCTKEAPHCWFVFCPYVFWRSESTKKKKHQLNSMTGDCSFNVTCKKKQSRNRMNLCFIKIWGNLWCTVNLQDRSIKERYFGSYQCIWKQVFSFLTINIYQCEKKVILYSLCKLTIIRNIRNMRVTGHWSYYISIPTCNNDPIKWLSMTVSSILIKLWLSNHLFLFYSIK